MLIKLVFLIVPYQKILNLKKIKKNVDILLHKGDFGIEPCAYVLGKDAVDVIYKVIKISEELK